MGVDAASTFCFLLSPERHRDADTWGIRLLEAADRGLAPEATVADFAAGLRAGQGLALPAVPCRGDAFHALYCVGPLVRYLENRAYDAITARTKLECKQAAAERRAVGRIGPWSPSCSRRGGPRPRRSRWPTRSVCWPVGCETTSSRWPARSTPSASSCSTSWRPSWPPASRPAPIGFRPVRAMLENQRENLLAFAAGLDRDLAALAREWRISVTTTREVLQVQSLPTRDPERWRREAALRATLKGRYHGVSTEVRRLSDRVVRASSLVENLDSRLRAYFFLRRQLGGDYLALLQFFLNHRRYLRSDNPDRVGKSPAELMTGQGHAHWLELLGYTRFSRA